MRNSTTWLRISYRTGAVADGLAAAIMLSQAILGQPSPITQFVPEAPYRYAMGLAGSLMLGWTILLLWADRRPVERRGVLMITNVVILGLMVSGLYAVSAEFVGIASGVSLLAVEAFLLLLFAASYLASVRNGGESRWGRA